MNLLPYKLTNEDFENQHYSSISTTSILKKELFKLKNRVVQDRIRIQEIERILTPIQGKSINS